MLYCATCQKGLPDGTLFCDYCGNEIADVSSVSTAPTLPDLNQRAKSSPANNTSRHHHGRAASAVAKAPQATESPADSESEQQTPPSLIAYTAQAPRPPEVAPSPAAGRLEGGVARDQRSTGTRVIQLQLGRDIFELVGQSTYLVGRRDVDQQLFPDVDLHDWDGADAGVSRRHLMIRVIGDVVSIEDLESRNSTILNGYRLFPHQQYPLVDGDEVRIGDITVLVRIIAAS
jgi:pSer/pThr/pTyr-binding forkhead associated (FHA) protein